MSRPEQTELERIRYWQGQMLRSQDFRDQTNVEAQMRQWHNAAVHNVFGVNFGLEASAVTQNPDDPKTPLIAVKITCGLAYDCFGRELILPSTRKIRIPPAPVATTPRHMTQQPIRLILVARYRRTATACCSVTNDLAAVCWPAECNGNPDELEFFWERVDCAGVIDGVPLARVAFAADGTPHLDNRSAERKDRFVAPRARAISRPHLANGMTIPGNTPWELWTVDDEAGRPSSLSPTNAVGMQTRIDTRAAGFTEVPSYFAWLQGSWLDGEQSYVPLVFPGIAAATIDGFTFRLMMPYLSKRNINATVLSTSKRDRRRARRGLEDSAISIKLDDASIKPGEVAGLLAGSEVLLTKGTSSVLATVESIDSSTNTVNVVSSAAALDEGTGLTATTIFNERFAVNFLTLAQRKKLYVCWLGCQEEKVVGIECPERAGVQALCI